MNIRSCQMNICDILYFVEETKMAALPQMQPILCSFFMHKSHRFIHENFTDIRYIHVVALKLGFIHKNTT